jgi:hypothetical protein
MASGLSLMSSRDGVDAMAHGTKLARAVMGISLGNLTETEPILGPPLE